MFLAGSGGGSNSSESYDDKQTNCTQQLKLRKHFYFSSEISGPISLGAWCPFFIALQHVCTHTTAYELFFHAGRQFYLPPLFEMRCLCVAL